MNAGFSAACLSAAGRLAPGRVRRIAATTSAIAMVLALAWTPLGLAPLNILVVGGAVGLVIAGAPLLRVPGWRWNVALMLWLGVSCLLTMQLARHDAPLNRPGLLYYWLAFPVAVCAFADPRVRRCALRAVGISLGLALALGLAQFMVGYDDDRFLSLSTQGRVHGRVSGFLNGYLTFGAVIALLSPLLIPCSWPPSRWRLVALGGVFLGLLLGGARLAQVGVVAGWGAVAASTGGLRRVLIGIGVAAVLAVVFMLLLQLSDPRRLRNLLEARDGRMVMWPIAAGMVADRPLIGWGGRRGFVDGYEPRWRAWHADQEQPPIKIEPRPPHAHNLVLVLATEHGIPAVLCHLGFLAAVLVACWRERAREREAFARVVGVLVVWLVAGQFNNLVGQGESAFAFYLALGWAAAPLLAPRLAAPVAVGADAPLAEQRPAPAPAASPSA